MLSLSRLHTRSTCEVHLAALGHGRCQNSITGRQRKLIYFTRALRGLTRKATSTQTLQYTLAMA